eukprot:gnl/MRDRNA2_/MRDRNA2_59388_c0_seq4.p1 gnl/MRDRNA2_/MRDRNA2_59388_c0~~gnl/MRDRNA2_/MRDRNA2_59388_c0_seq4.p1  ORF type:complete len:119 (+),score=7.11 gnl/MRDRNA2_/MRDRNA2_59388_c0_seq4:70-426(+)
MGNLECSCGERNANHRDENNHDMDITYGCRHAWREHLLDPGERRQIPRLLEYTDILCDLHLDGVPAELGCIGLSCRGYKSTSLDVVGPWTDHRVDGLQYFKTGRGMLPVVCYTVVCYT